MGYLGDVLGIRPALVVTNSLIVIGALASALVSWGSPETVWTVITASRFVLGVGVGGNYPLSAAKAGQALSVPEAVAKAGKAFLWQGPGSLTPYVVAWMLLWLHPVRAITSLQFRVLLGLGAVPSSIVLWATMVEAGGSHGPSSKVAPVPAEAQKPSAAKSASQYRLVLLGTAGTWFFFDVAYYGTLLFAPVIIGSVFGAKQTLSELTLRSAIVPLVGTFGMLFSIWILPRIGAKRLNILGLVVSAALYLAFSLVRIFLPTWRCTLFALVCVLCFVLSAGPGLGTYVLPVMSFPPDVRSTYHGQSAAAGKIGAVFGALLFPVVTDVVGLDALFCVQAAFCLAGALCCHCFVDDRIISGDTGSDYD
eukprot:TRINITY_DN10136_c0_g1_i1.p1 TRINITY_DN10136_c0_g1~~TRINITY_DN10136_c0_g1_i1.p1  ORF type:complete len:403 (+),score=49.40 TRINITY_DN10136_c0_g1_i1:117-1211(+)